MSVLIACHGDQAWADLAWSRAYPSAFQQADECLVVYGKDETLAQVRNRAAHESEGDWLVFLDADDELSPGYVDALVNHLRHDPSPLQLVVPQISYVQHGRTSAPKYWHHGQHDLREGNWMVIGTAVHRQIFDQAGGFREWPIYEDYDLWIRCVQAGASPTKVPRMVYLAHEGSGSRNEALPVSERRRIHSEIVAANYGPRRGGRYELPAGTMPDNSPITT